LALPGPAKEGNQGGRWIAPEYPIPPSVMVTVVTFPLVVVHVAAAPDPVHGGSQMTMAAPVMYAVPEPRTATLLIAPLLSVVTNVCCVPEQPAPAHRVH